MKLRSFEEIMPIIGENVYIDESATVIGKVTIGDDSSIWPYAVVRGDVNTISIGQRTNIQDHCVLHVTHAGLDNLYNPEGSALTIGSDVTVGHQCVLHACTIHDACLIGIGSKLLDDVIVESHTIIGANSLVPPGKHLESGFLYHGSPAKKIRPLTEGEINSLQYSAQSYVDLKDKY